MFCPQRNSYLQLVCAINPRVINKAVDKAMMRPDPKKKGEGPAPTPHPRMLSMQPSLYAPHVNVTRARMGFGRVGLRVVNRNLHSTDQMKQLQALHTILDQSLITENAMFLINIQVIYRLIDLMQAKDPVIREKVCMTLSHFATYLQGRRRIMSRPKIIETLMWLIMRDRKEIRYAAAVTLKTLARDRCACEVIVKTEDIIENLLKMIKHDHVGIVLLHLKTFENLAEWDPVKPLQANAFQVMLTLFDEKDPRIVSQAMECMSQLCKHDVGMKLADKYDLTFVLRKFLLSPAVEVIISTVGLMCYTTITTMSKWRAKEFIYDLSKKIVTLCLTHNMPLLQLRCLQLLINLCDMPDVRYYMKYQWEMKLKQMPLRTHEDWDGTSETTTYTFDTGHNYRTMCIEGVETILNEYGDNPSVINVHSYMRRLQEKKDQLIAAINWKPYT